MEAKEEVVAEAKEEAVVEAEKEAVAKSLQKLRKKEKMERGLKKGNMKSKSPADLVGGVLGCRGFRSSFRTTQRPTKTWIIHSDSTQALQSLIWFVLRKHTLAIYLNQPSFSNPPSLILDNV